MSSERAAGENATLRQKIAHDLRERVASGVLSVGTRLPSISELCRQYQVSDITIRAAIKELSESGHVESRRRSGVFVKNRTPDKDKPLLSGDRVLALLVPACDNAFFAHLIHGVQEQAEQEGYHVLIANSRGNLKTEEKHLRTLASQVAGLVIYPLSSKSYASYTTLLEKGLPFVFIDRRYDKIDAPLVASDNEMIGYMATRHLLECGRREVFVLSSDNGEPTSLQERLAGHRRALKEAGIAFDAQRVFTPGEVMAAAGYKAMNALLERFPDALPCGVFALTDWIARGAYLALKERDLRIPHDVALVGVDDDIAALLNPPLTTVQQNMSGMGRSAVSLLLQAMRGTHRVPSVLLRPNLVVRNSCSVANPFDPTSHILEQSV